LLGFTFNIFLGLVFIPNIMSDPHVLDVDHVYHLLRWWLFLRRRQGTRLLWLPLREVAAPRCLEGRLWLGLPGLYRRKSLRCRDVKQGLFRGDCLRPFEVIRLAQGLHRAVRQLADVSTDHELNTDILLEGRLLWRLLNDLTGLIPHS